MDSDLEAVARAYRLMRDMGALDHAARTEAERVYRERHPEAGDEAPRIVPPEQTNSELANTAHRNFSAHRAISNSPPFICCLEEN